MSNPRLTAEQKQQRLGERKQNTDGSWMEIIDYKRAQDITVRFDSGYIAYHKQYTAFKSGYIKDYLSPNVYGVGYMGIGEFTARINDIITPEYDRWTRMLLRCYGEYEGLSLAYQDCTVDKTWLNFQCFAQWYQDNYYEIPNHKMCLDKDIICKKNKIYSPDTCCFVPEIINDTFIGLNVHKQKSLPIGVKRNSRSNTYRACMKNNGHLIHVGCFNTPEEAFYAYKVAKEVHIKQMADKYKQWLPDKVYQAMYAYEIDIND